VQVKYHAHYLLYAVATAMLTVSPMESFAASNPQAERACLNAVHREYDRNVDLYVVNSSFSQAATEVIVDADGDRWRCLSSSDGRVEEVSRMSGSHGNSGWNSDYSRPSHDGVVVLFRDYDYKGRSEVVSGDIADMRHTEIRNDSLSSIRVPNNCEVTLYRDTNFRGRSMELTHDQSNLGGTRVGNDSVSSIEVDCRRGHGGGHGGGNNRGVTLYRDYDYRGRSETFYNDVPVMKGTTIGNDELSSIQVPRGCHVTLYADTEYRGRSVELYENEPELGRTRVGNDSVSSFRVRCR